MGRDYLGRYGNGRMKSPNLGALAEKSPRFTLGHDEVLGDAGGHLPRCDTASRAGF